MAHLLVHHALEHRAEDGGRNLRPVERTAVQKRASHLARKRGDGEHLAEKVAVHVGEGHNRLVETGKASFRRRVQRLEENGNLRGEMEGLVANFRFAGKMRSH